MKISETETDVLTLKAFDNQLQPSKELHPDLLQPPFTLMMVGPKGSSKTTTILRLIYGNNRKKGCTDESNQHRRFYRHYFDKIYVFSPTWSNDAKTSRCKIPDDQIFEDVEHYEDIITEILQGQEEDIREDGKDDADNVLMIFSDLAGTKFYSNKKGILNKVAFNHRHYKVSVLLDTQSLRQISGPFRNNLSGVMFFASISNRLEIKKITEEFLGKYTEKQSRQILKYAFKDSLFNFLYLNFQKRTIYKNFNPLTITTAEESEQ
jgi:hypothetical protein